MFSEQFAVWKYGPVVVDDSNGNLASFVVMAPTGISLIFFSLRCGELFEETY